MHALPLRLRLALGWVGLATACATTPSHGDCEHAALIRASQIDGLGITGSTAEVIARWRDREEQDPRHEPHVDVDDRVVTIHAPVAMVFAVRSHDGGDGRIHLVETVFDHATHYPTWPAHAQALGLEAHALVGNYTGIRRLEADTLAPDQRQGAGVLVYATQDPTMFLLVESGHDQLYGTLHEVEPGRWDSLQDFTRIEDVIVAVERAIERRDAATASRALAPYARVDDTRILELERAVGHLANARLSDVKLDAHRTWTQFQRELVEQPLDGAIRRLGTLDAIQSRFVDAHGNRLALTDGWPKAAWQQLVDRATRGGPMCAALGAQLVDRQAHWRNRLHQLADVATVCVDLDGARDFAQKAAVFEQADPSLDQGLTQALWRSLRPTARSAIARSLVDRGAELDDEARPHAAAAHAVVARAIAESGLTYPEGAELLALGAALDAAHDLTERCERLGLALTAPGRTAAGAIALRAIAEPGLAALERAATQAAEDGLAATAAGLDLWHRLLETGEQPPMTGLDDVPEADGPRAGLARLAAQILPALAADAPHAIDAGEALYALSGDWPLTRQFGLMVSRASSGWNVLCAAGAAPRHPDILAGDGQEFRWVRADAVTPTDVPFVPVMLTFPPAIDEFREELLGERAWLVAVADGLRRGKLQPDPRRIRELAAEMQQAPASGTIADVEPLDRRLELLFHGNDRRAFDQQRREFDRRRSTFDTRLRSYNRQVRELAERHAERRWTQFAHALLATRDARLDVGLEALGSSVTVADRERELAWRQWIFCGTESPRIGPPIQRRPRNELQILRDTLAARIRASADAAGCARHLVHNVEAIGPDDGDLCTVMVRAYLDRFGVEAFVAHVAAQTDDIEPLLRGIAAIDRTRIARLLQSTPPRR